jgi:hypothetical protein
LQPRLMDFIESLSISKKEGEGIMGEGGDFVLRAWYGKSCDNRLGDWERSREIGGWLDWVSGPGLELFPVTKFVKGSERAVFRGT